MQAGQLTQQDLNELQQIHDLKFVQFAFAAIGKQISITLYNGKVCKGNFFTMNPENGNIILKDFDVKETNCTSSKQVFEYINLISDDYSHFTIENLSSLPGQKEQETIKSPIELDNKQAQSFEMKIDSEISKHHKPTKQFEKWQQGDPKTFEFLNDDKFQLGQFDQFQTNKNKYQIEANFNESEYTTKIDYGKITEEDKKRAKEIEDELKEESKLSQLNVHIQEEREFQNQSEVFQQKNQLYKNQQIQEIDEEAKYSSILGTGDYDEQGHLKHSAPPNLAKQVKQINKDAIKQDPQTLPPKNPQGKKKMRVGNDYIPVIIPDQNQQIQVQYQQQSGFVFNKKDSQQQQNQKKFIDQCIESLDELKKKKEEKKINSENDEEAWIEPEKLKYESENQINQQKIQKEIESTTIIQQQQQQQEQQYQQGQQIPSYQQQQQLFMYNPFIPMQMPMNLYPQQYQNQFIPYQYPPNISNQQYGNYQYNPQNFQENENIYQENNQQK